MMPRSRRNGLGRELDVRDVLIELGWEAFRTAKEIVDVVALAGPNASHPVFGREGLTYGWCPLLVQVKSSKAGPYANFGPVERAALTAAAARGGAHAWLAWWRPRGQLVWIPSGDWPRGRERTDA